MGELAKWYKFLLEKTLNHKVITSIIAVVLLAGSLALIPLIGFSFLGSEQEKTIYLTYTPKAGELKDETLKNVKYVEDKMLKRDDIDIVQLSVTDKRGHIHCHVWRQRWRGLMYLILTPIQRTSLR